MATKSQHARKIMITVIAGSCGLLALASPDWRSEVRAQAYYDDFEACFREAQRIYDDDVTTCAIDFGACVETFGTDLDGILFCEEGLRACTDAASVTFATNLADCFNRQGLLLE